MTVEVITSGPLFSSGVEGLINSAIDTMNDDISRAGERKLQEMLKPQPGGVLKSESDAGGPRGATGAARGSTGEYSRGIHALVTNALIEITDNGAIYGPWLEGESSRNESTRFKGYSTFRRVTQWLEEEYMPIALAKYESMIANKLGGD